MRDCLIVKCLKFCLYLIGGAVCIERIKGIFSVLVSTNWRKRKNAFGPIEYISIVPWWEIVRLCHLKCHDNWLSLNSNAQNIPFPIGDVSWLRPLLRQFPLAC